MAIPRLKKKVLLMGGAFLALIGAILLAAADWFHWAEAPEFYLGYVEGDYVYVAAQGSGRIVAVDVARGSRVVAGQRLFALDPVEAEARLAQVKNDLARAQAQLADLQLGQRPEELRILEAQIAAAKANLILSKPRVERRRSLVKNNYTSEETVDEAEAAINADESHLDEMQARLTAARLPARVDQIAAAAAVVAAQEAALAAAQWTRDERFIYVPPDLKGDIRVEDVYYRIGETVAAGAPVLQLLPPDYVKIRFFVPAGMLGALKVGDRVAVRCDACAEGLDAHIDFIGQEAEFTPPVIYSRESRAQLVFLVEARPTDLTQPWHPGQPVEVSVLATPPGS